MSIQSSSLHQQASSCFAQKLLPHLQTETVPSAKQPSRPGHHTSRHNLPYTSIEPSRLSASTVACAMSSVIHTQSTRYHAAGEHYIDKLARLAGMADSEESTHVIHTQQTTATTARQTTYASATKYKTGKPSHHTHRHTLAFGSIDTCITTQRLAPPLRRGSSDTHVTRNHMKIYL
jgi:hypothetical protein